jgi:F-type H+-transporting ATPase subunit a
MGLVPHGASATANITVTLLLAFFTFVLVSTNASKDYWKHLLWPPGVPGWIKIILVPVEIIGLLSKHLVLAMRLFANMLGGTIVIFGMIGLVFMGNQLFGAVGGYGAAFISVLLSVITMFIKILVALIQAYIFALLSALFIGMAMEDHGDHHPHEHAAKMVHAAP